MQHPLLDEHSHEFAQLAGLFALGVLEGDDLARFRAHANGCGRCRLMVRVDRQALTSLSLMGPAMDPSPDFKARLMRLAAEELAAPKDATAPEAGLAPTPLRGGPANVLRLWRRSPWASVVAAVFVVAVVAAGAFAFENQTVATYQLTGSAPGSAKVLVHRSGEAELDMTGPSPDPGFVYEAWIIPRGSTQPIAAGIINTGDATLKLSADLRGATVAITKERGRVDAPTSDPIMSAVVPA